MNDYVRKLAERAAGCRAYIERCRRRDRLLSTLDVRVELESLCLAYGAYLRGIVSGHESGQDDVGWPAYTIEKRWSKKRKWREIEYHNCALEYAVAT
jgi:hypothetical protein